MASVTHRGHSDRAVPLAWHTVLPFTAALSTVSSEDSTPAEGAVRGQRSSNTTICSFVPGWTWELPITGCSPASFWPTFRNRLQTCDSDGCANMPLEDLLAYMWEVSWVLFGARLSSSDPCTDAVAWGLSCRSMSHVAGVSSGWWKQWCYFSALSSRPIKNHKVFF